MCSGMSWQAWPRWCWSTRSPTWRSSSAAFLRAMELTCDFSCNVFQFSHYYSYFNKVKHLGCGILPIKEWRMETGWWVQINLSIVLSCHAMLQDFHKLCKIEVFPFFVFIVANGMILSSGWSVRSGLGLLIILCRFDFSLTLFYPKPLCPSMTSRQ